MILLARQNVRPLIRVLFIHPSKHWALFQMGDYFIAAGYFSPSVDKSAIVDMVETVLDQDTVALERLIFVGDFNARMSSVTGDSHDNTRGCWFKRAILDEFNLEYVRPVSGLWTTITPTGKGVTDLVLRYRSDNAFVHNLTVHESCDMNGSDHRPLTWCLDMLQTFPNRQVERWNIARLGQPEYHRALTVQLHSTFFSAFSDMIREHQNLPDVLDPNAKAEAKIIVDRMYSLFLNWLNRACASTIGVGCFDVKETRADFDTDEIEDVRTALQKACGVVSSLPSSSPDYAETYRSMDRVRNEYKVICRDRRYILYDEFVNEMAQPQHYTAFQKRISAMQKRESRSSCQLDPMQMDKYADHFDSTFGAAPVGQHVPAVSLALNPAVCPVNFSDACIRDTLQFFKAGKAAGPDQVVAEMLHHDPTLTSQMLSLLFTTCFKYAVIPDAWRRANVALIYKNKGAVADVANYRPISLTSTVRRVYERCLLQYLVPATETFLESTQGGFRPKRGTLQQCYALHEILVAHPKAYHAFLDMKAAYDCVNRDILWRDMRRYGIPDHMVLVCRSLFDKNRVNLVVNGHKSRDIVCKRGLLQGSSLSPLLFNVFIHSLLVRLKQQPQLQTRDIFTNHIFFADDGTVHALGHGIMQGLLDTCTTWASEYGSFFNASKSAMFDRSFSPVPFTIQRKPIPVVSSFPYLGVEAKPAKGMCFTDMHKARCAKLIETAKFLKAKSMNALGWRTNTKVLAYKSFLRPIMEYGISLMPANSPMMSYMERTQNTVLNMMLSLPRSCSRGAKLKVLQLETMAIRREKLQCLFFEKLEFGQPIDSLAATIWHAIKRGRGKKSKMYRLVHDNPMFDFRLDNTPQATAKFMLDRKMQSTACYDTIRTDGSYDIAKSIATPRQTGLSAYTDPRHAKQDQTVLIMLRLGALTFHQPCAQCNSDVSRQHAFQCSKESERLQLLFANEYQAYCRNANATVISFPDHLLNTMDTAFSVHQQQYGDQLFQEMLQSAKTIRDSISGYQRTEDGRS